MNGDLLIQLQDFHPIVDTGSAADIEHTPEGIRQRYAVYASLYFPPERVKQVRERIIREIKDGRSVTGYVAADYGYGKTATCLYLWAQCREENIVATPPFLFRQLRDILQAVKGWLCHELSRIRPDLVRAVGEIYNRYVERSVEEMAEEMARGETISQEKARRIVEKYLASRRDLTTTQSVLAFLQEATEIAQQAGFKGLVVFADEIQEFLRTEERGAREAVQTLSELVKGIRGLVDKPLGLILSMPKPTEEVIEEQAGDILHRLREKGTALRLDDMYGREFPRQLWKHLLAKANGPSNLMEDSTLEALGQLCERKDLSNGPRTLISAFKRAIHHYYKHRRPYTPMDLIEDYLQGHIVFEGREAKITQALGSLLQTPAIRSSPDYQRAAKLLAVFPRGVSRALAGELYDTIVELAEREQWLGEHITQLSEGYALVALQEHNQARPLLDKIIRDFRKKWHHIWSEEQKISKVLEEFYLEILPELFPKRKQGQQANFSFHKEEAGRGMVFRGLEGTYEKLAAQFPDRTLSLYITSREDLLKEFRPPLEELDLDFRFLLSRNAGITQVITAHQDRRIDFILSITRSFGAQFPSELGFLRDIMAPERTSAEILLALSRYMGEWCQDHRTLSQENQQLIEQTRVTLREYAISLLFPDAGRTELIEIQGLTQIKGMGKGLVQSVFETKCQELYSDYHPLKIGKEWQNQLRRYREVLNKRPLAQRRGKSAYEASKKEIAEAFDWSVSAFESSAQPLKAMKLIDIEWGKGRGDEGKARIIFQESPLEKFILEMLRASASVKKVRVNNQDRDAHTITLGELQGRARRKGYLVEEVQEAVKLLILRQYVIQEDKETLREYVESLNPDDLREHLKALRAQLFHLHGLMEKQEMYGYEQQLGVIEEKLMDSPDEIVLDAASRELNELSIRLKEFIRQKAHLLVSEMNRDVEEMERGLISFQSRELKEPVQGAVQFVKHIEDERLKLQREFRDRRNEWEELILRMRQILPKDIVKPDAEALKKLHDDYQNLRREKDELKSKLEGMQGSLSGLQRWREIVSRVTALRTKIGEAEGADIDEVIHLEEEIMEHFARSKREALSAWEPFLSKANRMEAHLMAKEKELREQFLSTKGKYEEQLRRLSVTGPVIEAQFDPQNVQGSYRGLYTLVVEKLQKWVEEQTNLTKRLLDEFEYLIRERELPLTSERDRAQNLLRQLQQRTQSLTRELIQNYEDFLQYCDQLQKLQENYHSLAKSLAHSRMQKQDPSETEAKVLNLLSRTPKTLEDIRREISEHSSQLDEIFEWLKGLYRKGHLEIQLRRRE